MHWFLTGKESSSFSYVFFFSGVITPPQKGDFSYPLAGYDLSLDNPFLWPKMHLCSRTLGIWKNSRSHLRLWNRPHPPNPCGAWTDEPLLDPLDPVFLDVTHRLAQLIHLRGLALDWQVGRGQTARWGGRSPGTDTFGPTTSGGFRVNVALSLPNVRQLRA